MKIIISVLLAFAQVFGFFQAAVLRLSPLQDGGERFAYGEGTWQNLDIFIPEDAGDSADVMFFIHGGSWLFGNQTQSMTRFATTARDRGLVGVSVDYSKLGLKTTAADMAEEIYAAAEFVRSALSALFLPIVYGGGLLLGWQTEIPLAVALGIMAVMFVLPVHFRKPGLAGKLCAVAIGVGEVVLVALACTKA